MVLDSEHVVTGRLALQRAMQQVRQLAGMQLPLVPDLHAPRIHKPYLC
jgi:hypothetical protein